MLDEFGLLEATLKAPDAVGNITITVNLLTQKVELAVDVGAPKTGRPLTRLNWMIRQLPEAIHDLRLDVAFENVRTTTSTMVSALREDRPSGLTDGGRRAPRTFTVVLIREMGLKRGAGQGSFVGSVYEGLEHFYGSVVQDLKPWTPAAPKLSTSRQESPEPSDAGDFT